MTQLDTHTVLEIIRSIKTAQRFVEEDLDTTFECETTREYKAYVKGQVDALQDLRNHLQSFIEGQLNVAENNTGV